MTLRRYFLVHNINDFTKRTKKKKTKHHRSTQHWLPVDIVLEEKSLLNEADKRSRKIKIFVVRVVGWLGQQRPAIFFPFSEENCLYLGNTLLSLFCADSYCVFLFNVALFVLILNFCFVLRKNLTCSGEHRGIGQDRVADGATLNWTCWQVCWFFLFPFRLSCFQFVLNLEN